MNRKTFLKQWAVGTAAISLSRLGIAAENSPISEFPELSPETSLRNLFALDGDKLYLNTGGLGPPSRLVIDAVQKTTLQQAIDGETHHGLFEEVRSHAATFFGAEPSEISFTRNATEGNSIIASGLRLRKGDEVIFESHAHPGGSMPWMARQKEQGIRVRIFEPDDRDPEGNLDRIFSMVTDRTRVIQLSHVTAPTGLKFDVPAIAREARRRNIWLHVDGAQSAGMIPIMLHKLGCDSYATSGHKWLNGPQETGILYIEKNRIQDVGCAHAGAYTALEFHLPDQMTYLPAVQRHEYGTRNAASVAGLEAALCLQESIGSASIAKHGKLLVDRARKVLEEIPGVKILTPSHPEMYNSMLTFRTEKADFNQVTSHLMAAHHIRARRVSERGLNAVRVSFHVYHQASDVERLAEAVRDCIRA